MLSFLFFFFGRPVARVIQTQGTIKSSATVTGDLGFKLLVLRWNGKNTVTSRQLQQQRDKQRKNNFNPEELPSKSFQT